jgi:hypothetical protein
MIIFMAVGVWPFPFLLILVAVVLGLVVWPVVGPRTYHRSQRTRDFQKGFRNVSVSLYVDITVAYLQDTSATYVYLGWSFVWIPLFFLHSN